ncbi:MAG: hypothetical protein ACON4E_05210 [Flavobacteriales bacterium]
MTKFFLSSNIFVSLCVVALSLSSSLILEIDGIYLIPFIFFSTLFSYNFQRLVRYNSKAVQWVKLDTDRKQTLFISVLSFIPMLYYSFSLSVSSLGLIFIASLLTLLYPIRFSFLNNRSIRELPLLKVFLISFVWSLVSVGLLLTESNLYEKTESIILFLSRFFFVLAITIPFDIRDLKYDHPSMLTMPQLLGIKRAKLLALSSLTVFFILSLNLYYTVGFSKSLLLALFICFLVSAFLINKSDEKKNDFFFSFWVEGLSILMFLLLFFIPMAFDTFVL